MLLRKPKKNELAIYKKLETEFYLHHKPYRTMLQDVDPRKRNLKKEFFDLINERNSFFRFVELDGEVRGYIYGVLKKIDKNEKGWTRIGDLNSLVVLKKFRKKGVAKFMCKEFFVWLKSKKVKYVEASCNVKNKGVIGFNKKMGFKEQHVKFGKLL
ncbi:GNAT family N-acetyltransferase [archaeon]|jgi:GNAT superfamily N-acetyltransferase|nr:GNAT family N-acetyltransferase [archaeon]MBT4416640.1 GNAT family N-acetyltransferase [archaeon]